MTTITADKGYFIFEDLPGHKGRSLGLLNELFTPDDPLIDFDDSRPEEGRVHVPNMRDFYAILRALRAPREKKNTAAEDCDLFVRASLNNIVPLATTIERQANKHRVSHARMYHPPTQHEWAIVNSKYTHGFNTVFLGTDVYASPNTATLFEQLVGVRDPKLMKTLHYFDPQKNPRITLYVPPQDSVCGVALGTSGGEQFMIQAEPTLPKSKSTFGIQHVSF
ncbi:MAG: hypothetical protein QF486_01510 [Candidatus Woesearchaeota archaeon]|nr:hypothetical protein [Candidatus Woesearchaeota archaeon]MDP7198270.1 hypothetical protein [Candidatus Woesearchaeota archaeon]MDP7467372.1 hypothetical protein [Candidatus Woesearchaeota archaeon]MDP7647599.1 hypothetical protein [Candidatus Woesearchaeota archaeon]